MLSYNSTILIQYYLIVIFFKNDKTLLTCYGVILFKLNSYPSIVSNDIALSTFTYLVALIICY
jgi:hypothetical protein